MKINELVENMNDNNFDFINGLYIKEYLPIMEKKMFVMDIISMCTDDIDGFISADRFEIDIYFDMHVLSTYTKLEVSLNFEDMVLEYDLLCQSGLLDRILAPLYKEYMMLHTILNNQLEEILYQNSIDAQVVKIANKINVILDVIDEKFQDVNLPNITNINELINMFKN